MDPRADSIRGGYATIAQAYREHLLDELAAKPLDRGFLDAFAASVGSGRVVDVGCGPGQVTGYLGRRGVAVEGVDLSPEMIAQARAAVPELGFRVGDMFALPFGGATFAGLVGFYAIVHTPTAELEKPFTEFHRVVAPNGLCALAFHAGTEHKHVDELFGCATSLDFWFHPADDVVDALDAAGFSLEARLDRRPYPDVEYPSERCYLLARRR